MHADTLLVIGIHREELGFGDQVAALVDRTSIEVLRIPVGVPQALTGTDGAFRFEAQHREIYLQLRQQVKKRYRLLIDLHSGIDERARSADIYCRNGELMRRLNACGALRDPVGGTTRTIAIVDDQTPTPRRSRRGFGFTTARTRIPRSIWDADQPQYLGLEIYLPAAGSGTADDWEFGLRLVNTLRDCAFSHAEAKGCS